MGAHGGRSLQKGWNSKEQIRPQAELGARRTERENVCVVGILSFDLGYFLRQKLCLLFCVDFSEKSPVCCYVLVSQTESELR